MPLIVLDASPAWLEKMELVSKIPENDLLNHMIQNDLREDLIEHHLKKVSIHKLYEMFILEGFPEYVS
jgi:hypothetical protein